MEKYDIISLMKHCHCGFREHFQRKRFRKLGWLGVAFMVLHLLFHVVECLLLPSLLVAFGGHLHEEPAAALAIEEEANSGETTLDSLPVLPLRLCDNLMLCPRDLVLTAREL